MMIHVYLYISILIFVLVSLLSDVTTVRVSRDTLRMLEKFRDKLNAESLDEAIRILIMRQRKVVIDEIFGIDKGRLRSFTEEDRGEDRS